MYKYSILRVQILYITCTNIIYYVYNDIIVVYVSLYQITRLLCPHVVRPPRGNVLEGDDNVTAIDGISFVLYHKCMFLLQYNISLDCLLIFEVLKKILTLSYICFFKLKLFTSFLKMFCMKYTRRSQIVQFRKSSQYYITA